MESTKVAADAALNPHTAAKTKITLLDKAQKLIRMGIAIVPTYPGCRAPLFEDWQNQATSDVCKFEEWMTVGYPLPDGIHTVTEDHNIICVARKDGVQCFDVDDYEACLDLGMPPLPNSVFQVDTPSGGLHVPVNSTPATADLGNLNVHENKFNTNTKKILEFKAHNSAWCAPWQTRDDGGRYKPRDSRARILGQEQTEYISELVQWIKDHSVHKRAYERRKGSASVNFHPSFSAEEFLDRQGLEEHDSGTLDGAFHLVPDSCPLCGKEARDTTLAGAVTKFIFGGHGYGFICHACAVTTRAKYEQEMLKLDPEYMPWRAYQDEWIYADDDPVLLTKAFNIDEEICSITPSPIETISRQAQELEAYVNAPFTEDETYTTSPKISSTDVAPVHKFTYELSDTGNGERLVRLFGSKIRYIYETGEWMVWGPRGWFLDNKGELMRMTKFVTAELIEEGRSSAAGAIGKDGSVDKKLFKRSTAIAAHAQRSASLAGRKAMIASASNEKGILTNMEDWDADRWLLNVQNGVIDLRTQKFRERRPEDLCSKQAAAFYDPNANWKLWEAALLKYMSGDQEMVDFLARYVGYSLTGECGAQSLIFNMGEGNNGKDVFTSTIAHMMGSYAADASFETFIDSKNHSEHRNDLAVLSGAVRFVTSSEGADGHSLDETMIKRVTGQSSVTVRHIHGKPFTYYPQYKLWFSSNYEPAIKGVDMGIWRRVKRVPWEYTITEEEKIENFGSLLQEETPGILNWALRGLAEYVKTGRMTYPAKIEDATARYRKEMDIMGRFLSESCTIRSDASVAGSHLYRSYVSWCQSNGFYATNSRKFYKDLRKRLCGTVNENLSNRGAVFVGVGLLVEGHYPSQSDI